VEILRILSGLSPRLNVLRLQPFNVLTLAFLWWRLIDHLRLEWSINPQYAYGWAVPFLSLYLYWHRAHQPLHHRASPPQQPQSTFHVSRFAFYALRLARTRWLAAGTFLLLAALWLPIRLIQEANPEWRLVSWALALDVIGLTLFIAYSLPALRQTRLQTTGLLFPLCFILVAVPWPSIIEEPLVRALSRSTAALTAEALNLAGIPALQQGNLVEVRAGVVGIDEACSGIRSLQASLMLALFFGARYRLKAPHRLWLVLAGWLLAWGSNIARTALLAAAAAQQGMSTVAAWHDPVGLVSSLTCFLALALLARTVANVGVVASNKAPSHTVQFELASISVHSRFENCPQAELCQTPKDFSLLPFRVLRVFRGNPISGLSGLTLLFWLLLADASTEAWYRLHESRLPTPITWSVLPAPETTLQQKPLSPKTKLSLRFDTGRDITWHDADGRKWQAIFLYWAPGRLAARLANDHTPAICLSASGRSLLAQTKSNVVPVAGLPMRVHFYTATDPRFGLVHVLYCICEDRSGDEDYSPQGSVWYQRLASVLAGRRNSGQRSLELAVWGIEDENEARKQLLEQMQRIVRIENPTSTRPNA
jgi:exosortase